MDNYKKKDYYFTVIEACGRSSGFRLPWIESFPEAEKAKRKMEKRTPGCHVQIKVCDSE